MPNVGSIIQIVPGTYVDDIPYERTGTVTTYTGNTITLDPGASSTSDYYLGYFVYIQNKTAYDPQIIAYDADTKVATIQGWETNPSDPNQWSAGTPAVGNTWKLVNRYPVQKRHQWLKDGVDISGAIGLSYTPSTAGNYQVRETAFFVDNDLNEQPYSVTLSPEISITGSRDPSLVYWDNLEYLGCFTAPTYDGGNDDNFSFSGPIAFNPSGNNGQGSLIIRGHIYRNRVGEISIPPQNTWATNSTSEIPRATMLSQGTFDPIEGQLATSGITSSGEILIGGLHVYNDKLIVTAHGNYSVGNPAAWFWQRPLTLSTTGQVQGPFSVTDRLTSDSYPRNNQRCFAGYMANVPLDLQSKLGGPVICGLSASSIVSNTSDGPAIAGFSPEDFNQYSSRRGTVVTGSQTSLTIDGAASATQNFYVNWTVACTYGSNTNRTGTGRVTAYNSTSKVLTVAGWTGAPNAGDSWVLIPPVPARAMSMYADGQLQAMPDFEYQGIWNWTNRDMGGYVVPNGTRTVLVFGKGGNGPFQYAVSSRSKQGYKYFQNRTTPDTGGEKAYPYYNRCWAYDANELEQARLGNILPWNVKPYAVMNFKFPFAGSEDFARITGTTYDPATGRIFLSTPGLPYSNPAIHVYRVNNAVTVNQPTPVSPFNLTNSLGTAVVGLRYSVSLSAQGTPDTFTWTSIGSALPAWLTLTSDGTLSGIPPTTTTLTGLRFSCTNTAGTSNTDLLTLTVAAAGGETPAGIEVQVAPVIDGVQGSFITLSNFTPMTSWVDGGYIQDFWTATPVTTPTQFADMVFILSRQRSTNRVELWMHRQPYKKYRPSNATTGDYSWYGTGAGVAAQISAGDATAASVITTDSLFDVKITVAGSLITPVNSAGTTTRVRCATGTIRRLVSAYKTWDWANLKDAIKNRRVPYYDTSWMDTYVTGIPTYANTIAPFATGGLNFKAYKHDEIGGAGSSTWYDGDHSAAGGGGFAGRGLSQSWEAFAIAEMIRLNGSNPTESGYEEVLRKSAEYSGTFPQWCFLETDTLRMRDPWRGKADPTTGVYPTPANVTEANAGWGSQSAQYTSNGSWFVPGRKDYGWDSAHHYNNGQVAFEATRDPFYALLLQINAMVILSELSLASAGALRYVLSPTEYNNWPRDNNGGLKKPYSKYIMPYEQERSKWWSLSAMAKAKWATSKCPSSPFLHPTTTWDTMLKDCRLFLIGDTNVGAAADGMYTEIDKTATQPTSNPTTLAESQNAARWFQKTLSCYELLIGDGIGLTTVVPPPLTAATTAASTSHPAMYSVSTFMGGGGYGSVALTYLVASGLDTGDLDYKPILEKTMKWLCNRVRFMKGEAAYRGSGIRGAEFPIVPSQGPSGLVKSHHNGTLVFTDAAGWAAFWKANYYAYFPVNASDVSLSTSVGDGATQLTNFLAALVAVKKLNDSNPTWWTDIAASEIDAASTALAASIAPGITPAFIKPANVANWAHRAGPYYDTTKAPWNWS